MAIRLLIVDDAVVFRSAIRAAFGEVDGIDHIDVASNGQIALEKLSQGSFDVVILDVEMPVLNGIETLKAIRQSSKVRVIMFSAQTTASSRTAIEALNIGADDVVAKPQGGGADGLTKELVPKVLQFFPGLGKSPTIPKPAPSVAKATPSATFVSKDIGSFTPQIIVIGSSTGGPAALLEVLRDLPNPIRCPVAIVQHMPPVFTKSLSERLTKISGVPCHEATDGQKIANEIYVAPGGYHLTLKGDPLSCVLDEKPERNSVRPAVDYLFESAAAIFKANCMGFVLTGMGEDGRDGAVAIKKAGGGIAIESEESCVVWGMPQAVFNRGAFDLQGNLPELKEHIFRMVKPIV